MRAAALWLSHNSIRRASGRPTVEKILGMFTATTSWRAWALASSDRRLGFYDIGGDQAAELGRRDRDRPVGWSFHGVLST